VDKFNLNHTNLRRRLNKLGYFYDDKNDIWINRIDTEEEKKVREDFFAKKKSEEIKIEKNFYLDNQELKTIQIHILLIKNNCRQIKDRILNNEKEIFELKNTNFKQIRNQVFLLENYSKFIEKYDDIKKTNISCQFLNS
jgi:hypothetical protein